MTAWLGPLMQVALVVFMVGSLLGMGLTLKLDAALSGLADLRFAFLVVLCGFGLGPLVALGLAWLLALDPAYAAGLVLVGLTPCAPFLSLVATKADGDPTRVAAALLLSAVGTILLLPIAAPVLVPGLSVDAWSIARPLLLIVLLPLLVGMAVLQLFPERARRSLSGVRAVTNIAAGLLLALCAVIFGQGFIEAMGTHAIGAQAVFYVGITALAYLAGTGLPPNRRSVLTLAICTRNVGAAMAPVLATPGMDQRTVVMVVLSVPMQLLFAFATARWLRPET